MAEDETAPSPDLNLIVSDPEPDVPFDPRHLNGIEGVDKEEARLVFAKMAEDLLRLERMGVTTNTLTIEHAIPGDLGRWHPVIQLKLERNGPLCPEEPTAAPLS